ncbi:hypothetical protein EMPS_11383 [Entomortierella parvispora]|uniref:GH16 domain-containing protein n=1 Tax=Entomortierella parvispora TaxID=205924 RepID=A0A9P3HLM0_9FUNG|nr:hypothetical protein EMPS_11383 [Entomortierella parvispora]
MKIPTFSATMAGLVTMSSVLLQATSVEGANAFNESLTNSNNFVIANNFGPSGSPYTTSQVHTGPDGASLTIGKNSQSTSFTGGELIYTPDHLGYGTYSVDMMGSDIVGQVTGFYLISTADGSEIDVELTGLNSTRAWLNVWHDHQQSPVPIDLDFDVSKAWHRYEINWQQNSLTWSIDGKVVLTRTDLLLKAPAQANYKLALNSWVNIQKETGPGWAGVFKYPTGQIPTSRFRNLQFTP